MSQPTTTAVDGIAAALSDAWNAADGAAFAQHFTDDADFVNIFAMHVVGRSDVARLHQMIFDNVYKGSTNTFTVDKVRPLGGDALVALIKAVLLVPAGPLKGSVETLATAVLVRQSGTWLIASFQNTREQAPPSLGAPE